MTQAVVDRLEAVEVDEQQRDRGLLAGERSQGFAHPLPHPGPVGQPGQLVAEGQLGQPVLQRLALTDVAGVDDNASYDGIVESVREDRLDVTPLTSGVPYAVLDDGCAVQVDAVTMRAHRAKRSDEPQPRLEEVERVHQIDQQMPDQLALAVAEDPLDGSALPDDAAIGIDDGHHIARALHQ